MTYPGVDLVYIPRFKNWATYSNEQLLTLFSEAEVLAYRQKKENAEQFLASRFAVKEAFYKAISNLCAENLKITPFSLRAIARFVEIKPHPRWQTPEIKYDAVGFTATVGTQLPPFKASVTISHENEYALAYVFVEPLLNQS